MLCQVFSNYDGNAYRVMQIIYYHMILNQSSVFFSVLLKKPNMLDLSEQGSILKLVET